MPDYFADDLREDGLGGCRVLAMCSISIYILHGLYEIEYVYMHIHIYIYICICIYIERDINGWIEREREGERQKKRKTERAREIYILGTSD